MKKINLAFIYIVCFTFSFYAQQQQPNVLIFLIDDLNTDLGCYGNNQIKSPNIDLLAKNGVKYNQAYSQQALCAPSRISILTGLRPETMGIYGLQAPLRSKHKKVVTIPQLFKENGYKTISLGKVYHHANDDKVNWTSRIPKYNNVYVNTNKKLPYDDGDVNDEVYKDGRVAQDAIKALNAIKQNDKFLMVVGFSKPHLPFNAPKKYWDLYNRNNIKVPSRKKPINMYPGALSTWGELKGYDGIPQNVKDGNALLNDNLTKTLIHGYYACVSYMDAQVGKVMKKLNEKGLRKNTLVIFMSDHGYKIGEYGAWNKHSNMQMDAKVPLIISREISHAGRKTNVSSNALVENIDIFPTVIEACNLVSPKIDGKSLLSLTDNPNGTSDPGAYGVYPRGTMGTTPARFGVTVTNGPWRYTEWRSFDNKNVGAKELYFHKNSPVATENFANRDDYKGIQQNLKKLLEVQFPINGRPFFEERIIGDNSGDQKKIYITSPTPNKKFPVGERVVITASTPLNTGSVRNVNFRINGKFLKRDNTAPYSVYWTPQSQGTYVIDAILIDNNDKRTVSPGRNVVITKVNPLEVSITAPSNGASFGVGESIKLSAKASTGQGSIRNVNFKINGKLLKSDFLFPYETTWKPNKAGTYEIQTIAVNDQGERKVSSVIKLVISSGNKIPDEFSKSDMVTVFPNPTVGEFTITLNNLVNPRIKIFSLDGKKVYEALTKKQSIKIEKQNVLISGIYLYY